MFNVGGGELLVILLVALVVLGPTKLPVVARQIGGFMSHVRRLSSDFKREMENAVPEEVNELTRELDATRKSLRSPVSDREIERKARERGRELVASKPAEAPDVEGAVSTAAAAGMFPDDSPEAQAARNAAAATDTAETTDPAATPDTDQTTDTAAPADETTDPAAAPDTDQTTDPAAPADTAATTDTDETADPAATTDTDETADTAATTDTGESTDGARDAAQTTTDAEEAPVTDDRRG